MGKSSVALKHHAKKYESNTSGGGSRELAILEGIRLLNQRAANFHFKIDEMEDDGNCQFRSISHQLLGTQEFHLYVRHTIVAQLASQAEEFLPFFEGEAEWKQYLQTMGKNKTWGDELTLKAAADAFCTRVHVVTSTEENWYLTYDPEKFECPKEVFVAYVAPIHYNSINLIVA